jgi:hypothetical protein
MELGSDDETESVWTEMDASLWPSEMEPLLPAPAFVTLPATLPATR